MLPTELVTNWVKIAIFLSFTSKLQTLSSQLFLLSIICYFIHQTVQISNQHIAILTADREQWVCNENSYRVSPERKLKVSWAVLRQEQNWKVRNGQMGKGMCESVQWVDHWVRSNNKQ